VKSNFFLATSVPMAHRVGEVRSYGMDSSEEEDDDDDDYDDGGIRSCPAMALHLYLLCMIRDMFEAQIQIVPSYSGKAAAIMLRDLENPRIITYLYYIINNIINILYIYIIIYLPFFFEVNILNY
jgi:hypothetical protein